MDLNEYQDLAMRTDSMNYENDNDRLLNGLMGLNGESGEAIDIFKKFKFQGHPLDREKMIEELGDIMWYEALAAKSLGVTLDEIGRKNIEKLKVRYPEGFSEENSIRRVDASRN